MLIGQDTKTITGAKIIIETLKGLGVDTISATLEGLFWVFMMNCIMIHL